MTVVTVRSFPRRGRFRNLQRGLCAPFSAIPGCVGAGCLTGALPVFRADYLLEDHGTSLCLRPMPVVPSAIVRMIDRTFPWTADDKAQRLSNNRPVLDRAYRDRVKTLLDMCRQLPEEVLPTGDDRVGYDIALNAMESAVTLWGERDRNHSFGVSPLPGKQFEHHPITVIRYILAECPDDPVAVVVRELHFLNDPEFEAELGQDIEEAKRALANREWKSATVVGASAVEALLLWAIERKQPDPSHDKWDLVQIIPAAASLRLIEEDTKQEADLARSFRNFIHPGRVRRMGKRCDEGTAHGVRSAVLHVIRDLKKGFS